jgi:hypothetical protein
MLWSLLAMTAVFGETMQLIRRQNARLSGTSGPEPRDWALRAPSPPPHFVLPSALERDAWARRRADLDLDTWAGERYNIDAPRERAIIQPNPRRRQFILERMDGGESLHPFRPGRDVVREKLSPNDGPRRVGRRGADGRIRPVVVD